MKFFILVNEIPSSPVTYHTSAFANIQTTNLWRNNEITTCFGQAEKALREENPMYLKFATGKKKRL